MTRKHFRLIAKILRTRRPPTEYTAGYALWEEVVNTFARELEELYPRFDRERFERECYRV